jgi:hypothetical protein
MRDIATEELFRFRLRQRRPMLSVKDEGVDLLRSCWGLDYVRRFGPISTEMSGIGEIPRPYGYTGI